MKKHSQFLAWKNQIGNSTPAFHRFSIRIRGIIYLWLISQSYKQQNVRGKNFCWIFSRIKFDELHMRWGTRYYKFLTELASPRWRLHLTENIRFWNTPNTRCKEIFRLFGHSCTQTSLRVEATFERTPSDRGSEPAGNEKSREYSRLVILCSRRWTNALRCSRWKEERWFCA